MNIYHKLISTLAERVVPKGTNCFDGMPAVADFNKIIAIFSNPEVFYQFKPDQIVKALKQLAQSSERLKQPELRRQIIGNSIDTINNFVDYVKNNRHKFKFSELADIVGSFATLGIMDTALYNKLGMEISEKVTQGAGTPQTITDVFKAYATIGKPNWPLFHKLVSTAETRIDQFTMQQMVDMSWAFAVMDIYDKQLLSHFFDNGKMHIEQLAKPDITRFYQAFTFFTLKYPEAEFSLSRQNNDRINHVFQQDSISAKTSTFHNEVSETLDMKIKSEKPEGLYFIDVALSMKTKEGKVNLAISADDASNYSNDGHLLGSGKLRDNILWQLGWNVVRIDWKQWQSTDDKKSLLADSIRKVLSQSADKPDILP